MTTLSTFAGASSTFHDVLTIVPPRTGARAEPWQRAVYRADAPSGVFSISVPALRPIIRYEMEYVTRSRAEYATLYTFLANRRGRAVPFWLPTFQRDIPILSSAANVLTTVDTGYAAALAADPWRKYLILYSQGTTYQSAVCVTSAVSNGDGTATITWNETTLDFEGDWAHQLALTRADQAVAAELVFARLDSDSIVTRWITNVLAKVKITAIELPQETP